MTFFICLQRLFLSVFLLICSVTAKAKQSVLTLQNVAQSENKLVQNALKSKETQAAVARFNQVRGCWRHRGWGDT